MKIATLCLAMLLWAPLWAAPTASVELELKSDNIYRGESITTDSQAVAGSLRVDDVLLPGLFVRASADSQGSNSLDSMNLRARGGVGFAGDIAGITLSGSLDRVFNPALQADDYTEVGVEFGTNWRLLGYVDFEGSVSRAVTGVEHWYVDAAVIARDVLLPGLDLSVGTGYYQYQSSSNWSLDRNLWQATVAYRLSDTVSVYASRIEGNVGFAAQQLDDHTLVGIRISL